jgi:ATPase
MHIDVRTRDEASSLSPRIEETAKHLILWLDECAGESVDIYIGGDMIFTATVGRKGDLKIAKASEMAKHILKMIKRGERVEIRRTGLD